MTLVYHRIPECGGDTLNPWLDEWLAAPADSLTVNHSDELAAADESALKSKAIVSGPFGTDFWQVFGQPLSAVAIFRDPIDRIISLYYRWHSAPEGSALREIAQRNDIYGFARDRNVLVTEFVDNTQTWTVFADPAMKTRSRHRRHTPDRILSGALERLEKFAAVGVYEQWEDTMSLFSQTLAASFGPPPPLPDRPFAELPEPFASVDRERLAAALGARISLDVKLHKLVAERFDSSISFSARSRRESALLAAGHAADRSVDPLHAYLLARLDATEAMLRRSDLRNERHVRELDSLRLRLRGALERIAISQQRTAELEETLEALGRRHDEALKALAKIAGAARSVKADASPPASDEG